MDSDAPDAPCPNCGTSSPLDSPKGCCPRCAFEKILTEEPIEAEVALDLKDIPAPGETTSYVGDYELLDVVAHGGMGVVYRARQRSVSRIVALKLLLGGAHASADFKSRFRQEAELAAQLQHPHIVPVYEAGEHNGQPYFSMEYVEGQDLARLHATPLPPQQAAEYLKILADAVQYAHSKGVLHRDLKPSNILLGSDGRLRITDFGLAKRLGASSTLTLSGATLGTPGYLPPEQVSARRGEIGVASDVYSLGAVLYHLLTGLAPFRGEALADVLIQVLDELPVPPSKLNASVPRVLEKICLKCLAKKTADRFASAQDLAEALDSFLLDRDWLTSDSVASGRNRVGRQRVMRLALYGLVIVGTLSLAGFFVNREIRVMTKPLVSDSVTVPASDQSLSEFSKPIAPHVATESRTNSLGMVFVPVPGTHVFFSIWDTRVQDFEQFILATGYKVPPGVESLKNGVWKPFGDWRNPGFSQTKTHPVCGVGWADARAFCSWLTEKEHREATLAMSMKYRLPRHSEWDVAVGEKKFPWGDQTSLPVGAGNYGGLEVLDGDWPANRGTMSGRYNDGYPRTSPVGSFPPNRFGLFDMGGNVWQWAEEGPSARGGSWYDIYLSNLTSAGNWGFGSDRRSTSVGFRCVLETADINSGSIPVRPP